MYSPAQISLGTYLGGPLAAMYFLKSNFDALSKPDESKRIVIICILVTIALLAILPFLPKKFPNMIIPLMYLLPVIWVNKKYQLTKQAIQESEIYNFQSNWKTLWMSILWMFLFLIPAFIIIIILNSIGVVKIT